jgi:hypothetical protein
MLTRVPLLAVALLLSVLLLGLVDRGLRQNDLQALRDEQLRNSVASLHERLQTELAIGLELAQSPHAQALLEDQAARVPALLAVEVVSGDGVSLFSSDRGLRGQLVPATWITAMAGSPERWQVTRQGERSLGLGLRDAHGAVAGTLVLTYRLAEPDEPQAGASFLPSALAVGCAVLAALLLAWQERRVDARVRADLERLRAPGEHAGADAAVEAARVLAQAREALANADARARRIASDEAAT